MIKYIRRVLNYLDAANPSAQNTVKEITLLYGDVSSISGYSNVSNQVIRTSPICKIIVQCITKALLTNCYHILACLIILIILEQYATAQHQRIYILFTFLIPVIIIICFEFVQAGVSQMGLSRLDKKVNSLEARVLKNWEECVISKKLLNHFRSQNDESRQPESALIRKQLQQMDSNRSRSSSNQQNKAPKAQLSRFSQSQKSYQPRDSLVQAQGQHIILSPLIEQDIALQFGIQEKLGNQQEIMNIMKTLPRLFSNNPMRPRNKSAIAKGKHDSKIELSKEIKSECIKVGDLILLRSNQVALCDMLIVSASESKLLIQKQACEYHQFNERFPLSSTKQYDMEEIGYFKKSLTGTFYLQMDDNQIKGYVKLKNDPNSEPIFNHNILYCNESIQDAFWIIGMAIRVGKECRQNQQPRKTKQYSKATILFRTVFITIYLIILITCIIIIILQSQGEQDKEEYLILMNIQQIMLICPYLLQLMHAFVNFISLYVIRNVHKLHATQILSQPIDNLGDNKVIAISSNVIHNQSIEIVCMIIQDIEYHITEQGMSQAVLDLNLDNIIIKSKYPNQTYPKSNGLYVIQSGHQQEDFESNSSSESLEGQEIEASLPPKTIPHRFMSLSPDPLITEQANNVNYQLMPSTQREQLKVGSSRQIIYTSVRDIVLPILRQSSKDLINELTNDRQTYNYLLLQLSLNHITWSKGLQQSKKHIIQNYSTNQLDQKQIKLAKSLGYVFANNSECEQQEIYVLKIDDLPYHYPLIDVQIHYKTQRLIQLFQLPNDNHSHNTQYILFLREMDPQYGVKLTQQQENKVKGTPHSHNSKQWLPNESKSMHLIRYSYGILSSEEAEIYVNDARSIDHEFSDWENIQYQMLEHLIQQSCVLGIKYDINTDSQTLIKTINESTQSLFLYSHYSLAMTLSIAYESNILQQSDLIIEFIQETEEDLRALIKRSLQEFTTLMQNRLLGVARKQVDKKDTLHHIPSLLCSPDQQGQQNTTEDSGCCLQLIISPKTLQLIVTQQYFINNFKLFLKYSKSVILFQATYQTVQILEQEFLSEKILEITQTSSVTQLVNSKNPTVPRYIATQQQQSISPDCNSVQCIQLEEFLEKPKSITNINVKTSFFAKVVDQIVFQRRQSRLQASIVFVKPNSSIIVPRMDSLCFIFGKISPLLSLFIQDFIMATFKRLTILIITIQLSSMRHNVQNFTLYGYFLEIIYYTIIFDIFRWIISIVNLLHIFQDQLQYINMQHMKKIQTHQSNNQLYNVIISLIRSILIGFTSSLIYSEQLTYELQDTIPYFLVLVSDIHMILLTFGFGQALLSLIYYLIIYSCFVITQNVYEEDIASQSLVSMPYFEAQNILWIIVLIIINFCIDLLVDIFISYVNVTDIRECYQNEYIKQTSLHSIGFSFKKLEHQILKIFQSVNNIEYCLQKLLSSSIHHQHTSGINFIKLWSNLILTKSQAIKKWIRRSLIFGVEQILIHSVSIISLYVYAEYQQLLLLYFYIYISGNSLILVLIYFNQKAINRYSTLIMSQFCFSNVLIAISIFGTLEQYSTTNRMGLVYFILLTQLTQKFYPVYHNLIYIAIILILLIIFIIMQVLLQCQVNNSM